jgi:hypothetical protein
MVHRQNWRNWQCWQWNSLLPIVKQAVLNDQLKEMKPGSVMIKSYVKLIHQLSMVNPKECISKPMTLWIKLKLFLKENDSTFSIGVHYNSLLLLPVLVLLRSVVLIDFYMTTISWGYKTWIMLFLFNVFLSKPS